MRLSYNSPVILTYTLVCAVVLMLNGTATDGITAHYFSIVPGLPWGDPSTWFRLFSHAIGHADWNHLTGNFSLILLIGPLLEEKYGSGRILMMIGVTALVTGLLNNMFFSTGLLGASGVVFMLILLASFSNLRAGTIPITFILILLLFLGKEVYSALGDDNISQFAHIAGGLCGSVFGFGATDRTADGPKNGGKKKTPDQEIPQL